MVSLLIIAGNTVSFAQCDKQATLTSSVTNYLDAGGKISKTDNEKSVVTISKTAITIVPGSEEHKMTGNVKTYTCDWAVPYKEGRTVLTTMLTDKESGNQKNATITIEGKDGKVTLTFEAEDMQGKKIQVVADKFEQTDK